ncbi:MAG: hypothetical protein AAFZ15_03325 [Bacteroidota bacterium]
MGKKYLYGFRVQGIQEFIFETGKLKEIITASELVEQVCTDAIRQAMGPAFNDERLIQGAAGKIKYLFEDYDQCKNIVYTFPKSILGLAPGISVCQAVVDFSGELMQEHLIELEYLLDAQRNKLPVQHGQCLMISEQSRRTGKAGVDWILDDDGEKIVIDKLQKVKLNLYQDNKRRGGQDRLSKKIAGDNAHYSFAVDINEITEDGWLAIVHADANSLGKTIQGLFSAGQRVDADMPKVLKRLSSNIEEANQAAARRALDFVMNKHNIPENKIPLRPVILGGDDLSLIIRGDLALDFTSEYLKNFEKETRNRMSKELSLSSLRDGLTACAGIAYIKPNYPFHYGVDLAGETLCPYAKDVAKKIKEEKGLGHVPSCLSFHKVQSSFVEDYKKIVQRELTAGSGEETVRFNYGPYFTQLQEEYARLSELTNWVDIIRKDDAPKSSVRQWLSELHNNRPAADQMMERIKNMNPSYIQRLGLNKPFTERKSIIDDGGKKEKFTHLFDVLTIASI